MLNADPCLC